jgi:hypothetical protein
VRPGDIGLDPDDKGRFWAYRPAERTVFRYPTPKVQMSSEWPAWRLDPAGRIWACPVGTMTGDIVWSPDGGRSWRRTPISVSTNREGVTRFSCYLRDRHLVVVSTAEEAAVEVGSVPWPSDRVDLAPTPLDEGFNPWQWELMPGARLAFASNAGRLMLATDATNREFDEVSGPVRVNRDIYSEGSLMVFDLPDGPALSADHGRNWRRLDLEGGSWTSAG